MGDELGESWLTASPLKGGEGSAREYAQETLEAAEHLEQLVGQWRRAEEEAKRARWWPRARRLAREVTAARARVERARTSLEVCVTGLPGRGVGAIPGQWSALSVLAAGDYWPALTLEGTVQEHRDVLPPAAVREVLGSLPRIRVEVELGRVGDGGPARLTVLHEQLLILAAGAPPTVAAALIEHLPGELRPLPETVGQICRGGGPVILSVSQPGLVRSRPAGSKEAGAIKLHDIVVHAKGHGLGSAVLTHLCRLADREGVSIYGEMVPGHGQPDDDVARLAGWYHRHGFRSEGRPGRDPAQWSRGERMLRAPAVMLRGST